MVKACTHLHFNGDCLDALKFYEKCLHGKISFSITYGEMPGEGPVPTGFSQKIVHASLEFGGGQMLTADDAPPSTYSKPQGFQILLNYDVFSEAERAFRELSVKGQVKMPFGKTFWAKGFGMLVDQFGIPWMINYQEAKR